MKSQSGTVDAQTTDLKNSVQSLSQSATFPTLPNLVRSGSSKIGSKFSRRSTVENARLLSKSARQASLEFDKLEMLTNVSSTTTSSVKNHHQYGASLTDVQKPLEKTRRSYTAGGRRSSLNLFDLTAKNRPSTNPAPSGQSRSAFLDFFRRGTTAGGSTSTGNLQRSDEFDDLSIAKPVVIASDNARKKSDVHVVKTMQPRSPRYGSGRASLPEIERLIRISQKRKEASNGSGSGSTSGKGGESMSALNSDKGINGKMKALKVDY